MFGVRTPHIEKGSVPAWMPEGLRATTRRRQPVLAAGPAFGKLSPAEQDGALAIAMVALDLFSTGRTKLLAAVTLPTLVVGLPLSYIAGTQGVPIWVPVSAVTVTYVLGMVSAYAVWARRVSYRVDRRVADVLGRPVMDLMLDLDTRARTQLPRLVRLYLKLFSPPESLRSKRLDAASKPAAV